jgi:hypothetical protein
VHVFPFRFARRGSPLGIALTMFEIWRRLPPTQRRMLLDNARRHGPRLASAAAKGARSRAGRRPRHPRP